MKILIIGLLVAVAGCKASNDQPITDTGGHTGLLQHNVYFYLNDDVTSEEREQFEGGLKELLQIEDVYKAETGIPAATEQRDVTDHDFVYSIFSWFETIEDHERYQEHPIHLDFIDKYSHLWANVRVYDSEIISTR
ncbi:MAG: Dabb family protein [Balneolales bacterium]